jgi:cysteine desulfurase/selenocysteine lyase
MDFEKARADFPILKSVVYLDSAATSLTPEPVLAKTLEYYREYRANIHRGAHRLAERATNEYEEVYDKLARFFGGSAKDYFHTKNATEAINLVALGLDWKKGANVVTTAIEHHSNFLPWMRLAERSVIEELRVVKPISAVGSFSLDDFASTIDSKTQLVAITGASNVLGNRLPVQQITKLAHERGALVLLDAAQMAGHFPTDFASLGVDFAAFSGHKMLAPTGTGVLYHSGKFKFQSPMLGGGMVRAVSLDNYELMPAPAGEEAGTPNISGVIGMGAALDYLTKVGVAGIEERERKLAGSMLAGLCDAGAQVYGPLDVSQKTGVVSFNLKGIEAHKVALMADELSRVCIRSGHHCAMPLHALLGAKGSARASAHFYNNEADVKTFVEAIGKIAQIA